MKTSRDVLLFMVFIILINITLITPYEAHAYTDQNDVYARDNIKQLLHNFTQNALKDISKTYQYFPNIVAPPTIRYSPNSTQVTLCTQASENHLHHVTEIAGMWAGPISVSVFTTPEKLAHVIYTIVRMRKCNVYVRKYVQFHLACPIVYPAHTLEEIPNFDLGCNSANVTDNDNTINYNHEYIYPNNILRTISIKYAETAYVTSLDVDLVPTKDLNAMLQTFLKNHDLRLSQDTSKVVYVLPCFEFGSKSFSPMTKGQLLHLWPKYVRPFHIDFCKKCHGNTNYIKWVQLSKSDKMKVAYSVPWTEVWEPFYVARKAGLPVFDAQFKNYGYNRRSQICELYVAGYDFKVLNNGFVVHRGIKRKTDSRRKKSLAENARNAILFKNAFLVEVRSRYPQSDRKCL